MKAKTTGKFVIVCSSFAFLAKEITNLDFQEFLQWAFETGGFHILKFSRKDRKQYKICPEQDCEQLVFNFEPSKSMIEILELHENPEWKARVEVFKGWCKYSGKTWSWETNNQNRGWSRGSSKRSQSVPVTLEERRTNSVERARAWRDIGCKCRTRLPLASFRWDSLPSPSMSKDVEARCQEVYPMDPFCGSRHQQEEGWKGVLRLLRHEQPSSSFTQSLLQAPEWAG